jgi:hypothetical protein
MLAPQCLRALVGVTARQKYPSVAIISVNPRTKPTPLILCLRERWAITKRHEVVDPRAMPCQRDLNEISTRSTEPPDWLENAGCGTKWVFYESGHVRYYYIWKFLKNMFLVSVRASQLKKRGARKPSMVSRLELGTYQIVLRGG